MYVVVGFLLNVLVAFIGELGSPTAALPVLPPVAPAQPRWPAYVALTQWPPPNAVHVYHEGWGSTITGTSGQIPAGPPTLESTFVQVTEFRVGWPFRSMQRHGQSAAGPGGRALLTQLPHRFVFYAGLPCPDILPSRGPAWSHRLPIVPLFGGTIANTAIYGALLAAAYWYRDRRRLRLGLCIKCTYPRGSADCCSECGIAHRNAPRASMADRRWCRNPTSGWMPGRAGVLVGRAANWPTTREGTL